MFTGTVRASLLYFRRADAPPRFFHPLAGGGGDSDKLADDAKHALFTGGCPGEMSLLQVRDGGLRPSLALFPLVFRLGREETFFPRMIDADSNKADRASPLERFNLASIPDPTRACLLRSVAPARNSVSSERRARGGHCR
jgi:hypothetical protein